MIYLDMDGVIADMWGYIASINGVAHWKQIPNRTQAFGDLIGTDFFFNIPKFQSTDKLITAVNKITDGEWGILSSIIADHDYENAKFWKTAWLNKHSIYPSEIIISNKKHEHAVTECISNILVDDHIYNINTWEDHGGVGVLYQANENSVDPVIRKLETLWNIK